MSPRARTVAGVALLLLLAGCAATSGSDTAGTVAGESGKGNVAPATGAPDYATGVDTNREANRDVIVTSTATVRADDVAAARVDVVAAVARLGGRIDAENLTQDLTGRAVSVTFTVRVPAAQLDVFVNALDGFGSVEHYATTRSDVTAYRADLDARIAALRTSTARLDDLLATAGNVADLLAVERELAQRQAELDGLVAQRRALADQVEMATVALNVVAAASFDAPRAPGFTAGFDRGVELLNAALARIATTAGTVAVFVPLVALLAAVVVALRRRRRR